MRIRNRDVGMMLLSLLLIVSTAHAAETPRKIKVKVAPRVPELAERLGLKGTVRLEIEVAADGTVKSFKPLGGHPVLLQSAEQALKKWRYEPGPPSKEVVEFNFR